MPRHIALSICLLSSLIALHAPRLAHARERNSLIMRTFTTRDGLSSNIVRDVVEDGQGNVWFATMNGLSRYTPSTGSYLRFDSMHGARLQVMDLALDAKRNMLWLATHGGGVGRLRLTTVKGAPPHDFRWFTAKDGLSEREFSSLTLDSHGRVWAVPTRGGLARIDGERARMFGRHDGLGAGEIGRCAVTRDDTLYCGTYGRPVLQHFDGSRFTQIRVTIDTAARFYVHAVTVVDDTVWLATKGAGAIAANNLTGKPTFRAWTRKNSGIASDRVGAIHIDGDGTPWFATSGGVSFLSGGRWQTIKRQDGLRSSHIFSISRSTRGVWLGTLGGGATLLARPRVQIYLRGMAISGGLSRNDELLFAATSRGLFAKAFARNGPFAPAERGPTGEVTALHVRRGALWAGTTDGLKRLSCRVTTGPVCRPNGQLVASDLPSPHISAIAAGPGESVYVGTHHGLVLVRDQGGILRSEPVAATRRLPSQKIHDVLVQHGAAHREIVWLATENGIGRVEAGTLTLFRVSTPSSRTARYHRIASDHRGNVWASGVAGIVKLVGARFQNVTPDRFVPPGIYSRFVMTTRDRSLWFAVRGLGVGRLRDNYFAHYSSEDGLPDDTVTDVVVGPRGDIWFATLGGGIAAYSPDRHAPQTRIGRGADSPPSRILGGQHITFAFTAQDAFKDTPAESLVYSYRLDNGRWSSFSTRATADLPHLAVGTHTIAVRAMDRDLNIDSSPAHHTFTVLRPWWQQPLSVAFFLLTALVLVYALFRIIIAMRREREAVAQHSKAIAQRQHFVRLASHELRKPLSRLSHRAEMLQIPSVREEKLDSYLDAIERESREMAHLVDTLLSQAKVEHGLRLKTSRVDISKLAQETVDTVMRDQPQLRQRLKTTTAGDAHAQCDPFYLRLALNNMLDNAAKYAGGATALDIEGSEETVVVTISDLGPGIAPRERSHIFDAYARGADSPAHSGFGLGLNFSREVARAHGGDLVLLPTARGQTGCRFRLSVARTPPSQPAASDRGQQRPSKDQAT